MSSRAPGPNGPADGRRTLRLALADARAVVLVRAVEEVDTTGRLLPLGERTRAGVEAWSAEDDEARRVAGRARILAPRARGALVEADPRLGRVLALGAPGGGLLAPAVVGGFACGLLLDALGPSRQVHVLALPLLGLIVWNLAFLAFLAFAHVFPLAPLPLRAARPRLLDLLEHWTARLVPAQSEDRPGEVALAREATTRALREWLAAVAPLAGARLRRTLHAGAAAVAMGAVAGMYARGVLFAYRATWESTFLTPRGVDALLEVVLGPAAGLLGRAVPSASAIESPATGDAAPWIHLWAVTAALFVVLPRLALVATATLRARRLARRLPVELPAVYLRRIAAAAAGEARRVVLVLYSHTPSPAALARLRAHLLDLFGGRAEVRVATADYGAEHDVATPAGDESRVLLFSLAQTPEPEVHGALLQAARASLPAGETLLAAVDGGPYRRHLGSAGGAESRIVERRAAWDRVGAAAGVPLVHLDLDAGADRKEKTADATLAALAAGAVPRGSLPEGAAR